MGIFDPARRFFLKSAAANLPPEQVANAIVSGVDQRPDAQRLSEALEVRLANRNPNTMYSSQIVDTLPDADVKQRLSYQLSAFSHMASGAATVVIAADAAGEEYVLMGTKGNGAKWGLPAGYMNPAPSFSAQGIYSENIEPTRDNYERTLLATGKREADAPINRLVSDTPSYDHTPEDTAVRETREETNLVLSKNQLVRIGGEISEEVTKNQPHQEYSHYYLADLRDAKALPPVSQGDDLEQPRWVKLSDISRGADGTLSAQGKPISGGQAIEKAVSAMREKEYASFGVTKEAIAQFSHLATPPAAIGKDAQEWHKNALKIADTMQDKLGLKARSNTAAFGLSA